MAPNNLWMGSDVHIDIPGGDRRNRKRQGIAAAPSVHKAADCPGGEHRHDQFDYCHPEKRKHRGAAKQEGPTRPFPPARTIKQKLDAAFEEWYNQRREGSGPQLDDLYMRYKQLRTLYGLARTWEASPEGKEWVTREKVKRAKGQGLKSREHYEEKAKALQEKYDELDKEHKRLWEKYRLADDWKERQPYYEELRENTNKLKAARAGIARARSMSTLGFAREWTGIIQQIAGGVEPQISAIRTGSRAFAHYSLETGIIGISDRALELLEKVRQDPNILWDEGIKLRPEHLASAVSTLVHEFLHSVNPAKNAYVKGGITGMIEEGLTEAIANRMVARADVLSKLLGVEVEKGIVAKPSHPAYIVYTNTMEYMAERAAQRSNTEPEWFLGKWKFHTEPRTRGETILDDAGMSAEEGYSTMPWRDITKEAGEKLPKMKEERLAQRENKAFQGTVQKVLDAAWGVMGFVFKNDTWPPATPAPTGGGGGGPTAAPGSLVPVGMDVRHTGSPPKGVKWQKLPRQGGQAPGGGGAGAIQGAVKKHAAHDQKTHGRRGFEQLKEGTRQELRRRFPEKATARYEGEVMVSSRELLSAADPDDMVAVHRLAAYMQEHGYDDYLREEPIQIVIDKDGDPVIYDGNHRVAAANEASLAQIPIELWYHGGSEQIPGVIAPQNVLD